MFDFRETDRLMDFLHVEENFNATVSFSSSYAEIM